MLYDQRDWRNRLYQALPAEWFPDLEAAPNLAGILDMLANVWSSESVVERYAQFDISNSSIILINGVLAIPIGSIMSGDGVLGNPTVLTNNTQTINGVVYPTITINVPQTLSAGTSLIFNLPDTNNNGLSQFLTYAQNQSRLQTSTDMWLDLFGLDFFGTTLQRHVGESDTSYRQRLLSNVIAPRVSRCAVYCGLTNLTGFNPTIIEPRNTGDCGSYTSLSNPVWGGLAYNESGYYGSMLLPFQFFVQATRPPGEGIPDVNGYCMSNSGYATYPQPFGYISTHPTDSGLGEYVDLADIENNMAVTDDDIYNEVAENVAAGVIGWTNISSDIQSELTSTGMLGLTFYLGLTALAPGVQPGQITGSSTINLSTYALLSENAFFGVSTINLGVVASFDNPILMTGVSTLILQTQAAINTVFMGAITTLPSISTVANISSNVAHSSSATFSISTIAYLTSNNILTSHGVLTINTVGTIQAPPAINIGNISTVAYVINGDFGVTYLTDNFVLGNSTLTPAGGLLGQTFVLGTSKLGVNYGY